VTDKAPEVLFIAGWGRSGSTLLERLVGQHDGAASVGEMRDLWLRGVVENRRCGCGQPFSACPFWTAVGELAFGGWDHVDVRRLQWLRDRVDRPWTLPLLLWPDVMPRRARAALDEYAGVLRDVYVAIARVSERPAVIDSTKIATHALVLRRAGLELRVVHLVRDSRGVIFSWQKTVVRPDAAAEPDVMLRYGSTTASVRYVLYNCYAHLLGRLRLPYLLLRYEDLARDPQPALRSVFGLLGLAGDGAQQGGSDVLRLQATHTIDGNPMRLQAGPVRVALDERWRREMPARSRRWVTLLTAPLLLRYGYAVRGVDPSARPTLLGSLRARRAA
jgi:hypothetical protein